MFALFLHNFLNTKDFLKVLRMSINTLQMRNNETVSLVGQLVPIFYSQRLVQYEDPLNANDLPSILKSSEVRNFQKGYEISLAVENTACFNSLNDVAANYLLLLTGCFECASSF